MTCPEISPRVLPSFHTIANGPSSLVVASLELSTDHGLAVKRDVNWSVIELSDGT